VKTSEGVHNQLECMSNVYGIPVMQHWSNVICVCLSVSVFMSLCVSASMCDYRVEKSTDQVIKPVNLEALGRWADSVPADVRRDIHKIAPMLSRLGYDADSYPPSYGQADALVANNTLLVKQNMEYWQHKAQDIIQRQPKVTSERHSDNEHVEDDALTRR